MLFEPGDGAGEIGQQRRRAALCDAGRVVRPGDDVAPSVRCRSGRIDDRAGHGDRLAVEAGRAIDDAEGLGVGRRAADLRVDVEDGAGLARRISASETSSFTPGRTACADADAGASSIATSTIKRPMRSGEELPGGTRMPPCIKTLRACNLAYRGRRPAVCRNAATGCTRSDAGGLTPRLSGSAAAVGGRMAAETVGHPGDGRVGAVISGKGM